MKKREKTHEKIRTFGKAAMMTSTFSEKSETF